MPLRVYNLFVQRDVFLSLHITVCSHMPEYGDVCVNKCVSALVRLWACVELVLLGMRGVIPHMCV